MGRDGSFTDKQILTLIRTYPGLTVYGILSKAIELNMIGKWSRGKIYAAIQRLQVNGKVCGKLARNGDKRCRKFYYVSTK